MAAEKGNKIDQLTGLRFFAALLVFFSHSNFDGGHNIARLIFESGYVGVSFFFVLSGFVLAFSYQQRLSEKKITVRRYIFLRFARLMPLHLLTAIPFVIWLWCTDRLNIGGALLNLTLLQSWVPHTGSYFSLNAPSWSLSNEIFFYVCFVSLATVKTKVLRVGFLCLLLVIFLSAVIMTINFEGLVLFGSSRSLSHFMFYVFPVFRLIEFIFGMLLYRLWINGFNPVWYHSLIAYFVLLASMYFAHRVPEAFRFSLFFLPVIGFFLFAHLKASNYLCRFYSLPIMILLGNASFAFYLVHLPIINMVNGFDLGLSPGVGIALTLLCSILVSLAVHVTFERWADVKLKTIAKRL